MENILAYIKLARPHQFVKNLFVIAPLFFGLQFTNPNLLSKGLGAAFCFYFVSVCVYVFNDYRDMEMDKLHPKKKSRPLAAGTADPTVALVMALTLLIVGFVGVTLISPMALFPLVLYFLLNLGYSSGLKNFPILDVAIVASGFLLRLIVGSVVTNIHLSSWLIIIVFLASLLIALGKRRDDIQAYMEDNVIRRQVVTSYSLEFVDHALNSLVTITVVAYIIYTLTPETIAFFREPNLYLTSIPILLGALRYMQLVYTKGKDSSPLEMFFKDKLLLTFVFVWLVSFGLLIYL